MESIFAALFEPVPAALLLLETAAIALIWVMMTPFIVVGDNCAIERTI